ncbi:hypothetical protein GCM10007938_23530 [Vibrio zhanjiangensis]|uniref:Peptidase S74 domain-containing protein n=1 Tax=Vibrio zhanjiangensis TaxID=1046128 RepID=A0ABQ6F0M9_9VIBR|nr:tail fiber domain-containing protein [Vibrio zhanjiangensis]GLT18574.1 hypothetical protein GCM10007938_23530 [Vibrio zhanjiangensis]
MKHNKILLYVSLALASFPVAAQEFSIFCYDQQKDEWEWSDNDQVFDWPVITHENTYGNSYFKYVPVSQSTYQSLANFCPEGTVPQPAEGHFSTWKVFYVTDGSRSYFAPGKRSYHSLIDHVFLRFSDVHLKENIQKMSGTLDEIKTLNGYKYNYINQYDRLEFGLIAQEVQRVYPDLTHTDAESGYLKVDYRGMIPVLLESIKEMDKRIIQLESRQP